MNSRTISRVATHYMRVAYWGARHKFSALRRVLRTSSGRFVRPLLNRWRFVAVTGSCGKTTTTGLMAYLVGAPSPQLLTRGLNNASGAARAFFHLMWRSPAVAVFEVTGHAPGAIRNTTSLLKPASAS